MARNRRPTGDDATNARKRFYRSAERYLKQAEKETGAAAEKLRYLAKRDLKGALATYTKNTTQQFSKPIQNIAAKLGVDLQAERQKIKARSDKAEKNIRREAIRTDDESRSAKRLESQRRDKEARRQEEARIVFNSPIGKRIIGGTVDIWREAATEYKIDPVTGEPVKYINKYKILPALYEYFEVDNLADLLEAIEDISGESLYQDESDEAMYETVKITLQTHIASDNSVTV